MQRILILAAGLSALGATAAFGQAQPGPGAVPPPPSSEGTDNPYAAPRGNDAGDSLHLSPAEQARKAIRDARDQKGGKAGQRVPAEAADIVAGRDVRDKRGKGIGLVESVEPDGAVVATEVGRVKVPLEAFGKDGKGLMLDLTKGEFDKLVAEATAAAG